VPDESQFQDCPGNDSGLTLPAGFCATVFADDIGHARHLTVSADGIVYVNTWNPGSYADSSSAAGGFVVALADTRHVGKADVIRRFGATPESGGHGGTGIALYNGYLYTEEGDRILRYRLSHDSIMPSGPSETVLSGLPLTGDHPMHPFVIDATGQLYVDVASATNSCQRKDRVQDSPGIEPCVELETRGGIWRYDARRLGQTFSSAARYATGIRNAEGLSLDAGGRVLYATQHGRDQLSSSWPSLYTSEQGAFLPAEELLRVQQGGDYGWPECYYDGVQKRLVLAPEYGGDGGKAQGACAQKVRPVAAFPAHWAPNDLLLYHGRSFPAHYQGGAFIAFHGSWNRAPFPQGGYKVVFQPLTDGSAAGPCEIFASGFDGGFMEPGRARQRPTGLALAPDGALFVADDVHGRIYRIEYRGGHGGAAPNPTPCPDARSVGN
jgi:glucose/arabinose dehydrogenase